MLLLYFRVLKNVSNNSVRHFISGIFSLSSSPKQCSQLQQQQQPQPHYQQQQKEYQPSQNEYTDARVIPFIESSAESQKSGIPDIVLNSG